MRSRTDGFTLLELLLALVLLALTLSLVQGAYSGAERSRRRSTAATEAVHGAALALDRLATELASATASAKRREATGLVGELGFDGFSTLSFTTVLPPLFGILPGGEAEVGYAVEADAEGVRRLLRREARDVDGTLEEGGDDYEVLVGLTRFTVRFYDGTEWQEAWDSSEGEEGPLLPRAVAVELAWGEGDGERVLRTATPLIPVEAKR